MASLRCQYRKHHSRSKGREEGSFPLVGSFALYSVTRLISKFRLPGVTNCIGFMIDADLAVKWKDFNRTKASSKSVSWTLTGLEDLH